MNRIWWVPALALALWACGDDSKPAADTTADVADTMDDTGDEDTAADVEDDATDTAEVASIGVVRAWSQDGTWVKVRFDAAPDPETVTVGAFTVATPNDAEATVTGVTLDGSTATLTIDPALDAATPYEVTVVGVTDADGNGLAGGSWLGPVLATVYLNLVWHQHQPSYLDPGKDELQGPWVRKHATKDYFDMTAMVAGYPKVHFNVNLTSSLLNQLDLYLDRLAPYVDVAAGTVDEAGFLAAWRGKTDPWVDLLLDDTPTPAAASDAQLGWFYADTWSCRSIAEPLRAFFPEYEALLAKDSASYTQLDLALLKVWFELGWMDPGFLDGPVTVYDDGGDVVVDLSDVVVKGDDGTYTLAAGYDDVASVEALANRLVAENYKIMKGVFEIHKALGWTGTSGQVEVLTTPFFHPILPLLHDTNLAQEGQPADTLPEPAFQYPGDAFIQIDMAVEYYTRRFGRAPRGMWPSEGSVAEEIVPAFRESDIDWIATDRQVLEKGMPGASHLQAYHVDSDTVAGNDGDDNDVMMIVFRDTDLSDKVGFFYQANDPAENAADFVVEVESAAGPWGEPRRLLSVILDGENAWEWYLQDHDAKQFLAGAYAGLEAAYDEGSAITVTGSEYIDGNAARDVDAHPVAALPEYEDLWPGSWIGGRFDTWIGEVEENLGWNYLKVARDDIEAAKAVLEPKLGLPESYLDPPDASNTAAFAWWSAWRAMLSAEGSDWFWWYGSDQTSAGGDAPFDAIYRSQLTAMYQFLNIALSLSGEDEIEVPAFPPILQPDPAAMTGPFEKLPVLDGELLPDDSEWTPPGGLFYDNDTAGAIDDPNDDIGRIFYGYHTFQNGRVFVGIELKEDLSAKLQSDYQLVLYTSAQTTDTSGTAPVVTTLPFNTTTAEGQTIAFSSGGPARRIAIDFSGSAPAVTLQNADGNGGWETVTEHNILVGGPVVGGALVELRFLMPDLGMSLGDPLEMAIVAVESGAVVDTAPNLGTQIVFADPSKLVRVILEVDATGSEVALDAYSSILDPPPPAGTGEVSIVGNQQVFANWTPNTVFMKDDGVAPDTTAGDNIWTLGFDAIPGTDLQYKYTIGHAGDGWGGTEEYPLTNRGYTVPASGARRVRVRDVFADRPDPSGSMAARTSVTVEE
ncbi:MAG: hypothetical protein EP329_21875 [Deltaproteobacteria bacterium]|nr:MAG: hypothetical protein EP329_21875 [Deltaproteobacteria bacterium]